MAHDHGLHLGGPEPLAGKLDGVVGPTVQEPLTIGGDRREVAVPPHVRIPRPVGLEVALRVVPEPARHARPRLRAHELTDLTAHRVAGVVEHVDGHTERRTAERARRQRLDHVRRQEARTHLGATRDVDDRAATFADLVEEPAPRAFVPRFAGGGEDAERRPVVRVDGRVAVGHERADQGGRHTEHTDAVAFDE